VHQVAHGILAAVSLETIRLLSLRSPRREYARERDAHGENREGETQHLKAETAGGETRIGACLNCLVNELVHLERDLPCV
jgi:hypothetical protein